MNYYKRLSSGCDYLDKLFSCEKIDFATLTPSKLQKNPGVYAIFDKRSSETLYVGRTKNLQQRLYNNHLMGSLSNARLKKYLVYDPTFASETYFEDENGKIDQAIIGERTLLRHVDINDILKI